jgi:hypothetical protein
VVLGGSETLTLRRLDDNTVLPDTPYRISSTDGQSDNRRQHGIGAGPRHGTGRLALHLNSGPLGALSL